MCFIDVFIYSIVLLIYSVFYLYYIIIVLSIFGQYTELELDHCGSLFIDYLLNIASTS